MRGIHPRVPFLHTHGCHLRTQTTATLNKNSLLAKHHVFHGHQIDLENVEIIDRSSTWRQRLILEAWHSVRDRNSINEHIALPKRGNNLRAIKCFLYGAVFQLSVVKPKPN